jgi:hypothetical protein
MSEVQDRSKGKRQGGHTGMINMLKPAVTVSCGGNVQVASDFLHPDAPVDATGGCISLMVVGWLESWRGTLEDGEEAPGPSRGRDDFAGGLNTAVFTASEKTKR